MLLAVLMLGGCQTYTSDMAQLLKLGRDREQFGDPYDWNKDVGSKVYEWNNTITTFPIKVGLFPAGSAQRRLYLFGGESDTLKLYCVVKKNGKVYPEWKLSLQPGPSTIPKENYDSLGTLELHFIKNGYKLDGMRVPKVAWPVLRAKKLFAAYRYDSLMNTMSCGVLHESGHLDIDHNKYPVVEGVTDLYFPYLGYDYPVTQVEVDYIRRMKARSGKPNL